MDEIGFSRPRLALLLVLSLTLTGLGVVGLLTGFEPLSSAFVGIVGVCFAAQAIRLIISPELMRFDARGFSCPKRRMYDVPWERVRKAAVRRDTNPFRVRSG